MIKTELEKQKEINKFLASAILEHYKYGQICPATAEDLEIIEKTGELK